MQTDSETRKEAKENSTGHSNEVHENYFGFQNNPIKEIVKKEQIHLTSPKFDCDTTSDDFSLYYQKAFQLALPEKFTSLDPQSLALTLKGFFDGLQIELQSKLWSRYLPNLKKTDRSEPGKQFDMPWFFHTVDLFMRKFKAGEFERSFHEEEKITQILDQHFYAAKINKNYIRACQNYSKREFIQKENGDIKGTSEAATFTGISPEEVKVFNLDSDDSLDSLYFEFQSPEEEQRTISIEISEREMRGKRQAVKVLANVPKSSNEEIKNFQTQEQERYTNPTSPYLYRMKNGETRWVAAVCKKMVESSVRPRDHFLLVPDRPFSVTILSLVRDATAKLPKGYGTRNDICELLKESQFINAKIDEDKMSSVVSGALDRLHYEKDPCVKFDTNRKLWIYLHAGRTEITSNSPEREIPINSKAEKTRSKKVKTN